MLAFKAALLPSGSERTLTRGHADLLLLLLSSAEVAFLLCGTACAQLKPRSCRVFLPAQVFDFQSCRTNSFIVRWIKRGYRAGRIFPLCALNMPRSFLVKKVKLDDFSSTELESAYGRSGTDLSFRIHDKGKCKGMLIYFDLALFNLIQAEFYMQPTIKHIWNCEELICV